MPDVIVTFNRNPETNPEAIRARTSIPIWPALRCSYLMRGRKTIAVAGTHGKTTTSSMVATMLTTWRWIHHFGLVRRCGYDTTGKTATASTLSAKRTSSTVRLCS